MPINIVCVRSNVAAQLADSWRPLTSVAAAIEGTMPSKRAGELTLSAKVS